MINKKIVIFTALTLGLYSSVIRADSRMGLTPDEVAFAQSLFQSDDETDPTIGLTKASQSTLPSSQKILALLKDKTLVMTAVNQNGLSVQYAHPDLRDDVDVMMRAVQKDGLALAYASDRLKDNAGIVRAAIRSNPDALKYASKKLQDDKTTVLMAVGNAGKDYRGNNSFRYVSSRFQNDKSVVLAAIRQSGSVLKYVNDSLKNDPQIIQVIIKSKSRELQLAGDQIRNNKYFILKEVQKNPKNCGGIVDLASDQLKADRDFVLRVFQTKGCTRAFSKLPAKLRKDKALAKIAIRQDGYFYLDLFDPSFNDDWSIIKLAPKGSQFPYQKFSKRLRKDKEIFKTVLAIQKSGVFRYADASIRDNKALALMALKVHGYDLQYVSTRLKKDYQVVKTAVSYASEALKHADKSMQNNKEIVMLAVKGKYPSAFKYASPALKKDKDLLAEVSKQMPKYLAFAKAASPIKRDVLVAVRKNGNALKYALNKFKKDKEIVYAAVHQSGHAIRYANKKLQNNTELKQLAIKTSPDVLYYLFARNKSMQIDRDIVIATMKESAFNYRDLDKQFRADKAVVLAAINSKSGSLKELRKNTFIDDDIVNALVDHSLKKPFGLRQFLHYLSKPISNKARLLRILRKDGLALEYASPELKRDRTVIQTAIYQNGNAIAFADKQFKFNKSMAKVAIEKSKLGEAFDYIDSTLQTDRELLSLAMRKGNKNILRQLYSLLGSYDNNQLAKLILDNENKSLEKIRFKTSKVHLDMRKLPNFYLPDFNVQKEPKFVLSDDKTRIAGIVDLRPQGVGYVAIWNSKTGRLLHSTRLPYSVLGFGNVSFTPDNKRLVASSGGFIWSFSKGKKPVMCYLDSTIIDINNSAILMHPNDWVEAIYDLDTCETIALANRMNIPKAVIGPQNKMLMLSVNPLSKKDKDIVLYRKKPEHLEHSKNFKHKVDLWDIPLAKNKLNASTYTIHNSVKKYYITMRYDSRNTLTISKWNYMKKRLIWRKAIKNMKPLARLLNKGDYFQDPLYKHQADLAHNRLYIADKTSVRIINLKNGRVIKKTSQAYKKPVTDYSSISPFNKAVIEQFELQGITTEDVRRSQNNGSSLYVTDYIFKIENEEITRVNIVNDKDITLWKVKRATH